MSQSRFFLSAGRHEAERIFRLVEQAFDDDGFPVSLLEVDEDKDIHEVSLYVDTADAAVIRARLELLLGPDFFGLTLGLEDLPDIDWVTHSLNGLVPVRAGRFVVHGAHDRDCAFGGEIAIEIDAGLAFGTGHHGTTSGCLDMIAQVVRNRRHRNVLDLGTGSGVLAIAVARLAKIPVLASDIDPIATRVAQDNVRLNLAGAFVRCKTAAGFHRADIRRAAPFDLIIANILAKPLMQLAPQVARHLSRGGDVILSGILASQRERVLAAYRTQALFHRKTLWRNGWVTLHLR